MMDRPKKSSIWLIALTVLLFVCICLTCMAVGSTMAGLLDQGADLFREIDASWTFQSGTTGASRSDGTLRLVGGEPITLDPALVEDSTSAEYVDKIFSGLVSLDAQLQIRPELAERWELSPDGMTYTFFIHPDARFQDGRPITAADVLYSLDRSLAPETGSTVASLYLGDIVGAKERLAGQTQEVKGIAIVNDRTVRITIDAPKAYFLSKLTYSTAAVVDRNDVERGPGWTERPNGTGPYHLVRWTRDEIVLEANPHYFRGEPSIERVEFNLSPGDPTTMYETGELDAAAVGLDDFERVGDPTNPLHTELREIPSLNVQYVGMNTRAAPFDDVKVRQAFLFATDREAIAHVMFKDSVEPAWGILPPGLPGYNDRLPRSDYDPERARSLLEGSRYGGAAGLPHIVFSTSLGGANLAEALASMYSEVLGVEIEIQQLEWGDFLSDLNRGRHQMFFLGWSADYPDPQNFLDIQFHSESEGNNTSYANPGVDQLLEQARVEQDAGTRMAHYQSAEEIIVAEAPWIPLYHGTDYVLVKPYVKGLSLTPQGMYYLEDAYFESH